MLGSAAEEKLPDANTDFIAAAAVAAAAAAVDAAAVGICPETNVKGDSPDFTRRPVRKDCVVD